jgi:hypothetical protein
MCSRTDSRAGSHVSSLTDRISDGYAHTAILASGFVDRLSLGQDHTAILIGKAT